MDSHSLTFADHIPVVDFNVLLITLHFMEIDILSTDLGVGGVRPFHRWDCALLSGGHNVCCFSYVGLVALISS